MKKVSVFLIVVVLVAGIAPGMAGCGGTPAGAGIRDWYDLDAIQADMSGNHLLMNDLDSSTAGYDEVAGPAASGGKGWQPIGSFTGTLDGQGYEIRDLVVNRPDEDYVGLFGYVGEGGVIRDIGARNILVTGHDWVGGLVGRNEGTVIDSYSVGNVIGEEHVGILIGYDSGNTVSNSYYNHDESLINGENMITTGALSAENFEEWLANNKFLDVSERLSQEDGYYLIGSVSDFKELLAFGQDTNLKFRLTNDLDLSSDPNFYIPYLAGEFDGDGHIISNLRLNLSAVSTLGLFGHLVQSGSIYDVGVENVNITGDYFIGGLVGGSHGTVHNCYATGNLTGWVVVGGLVGDNSNGGTVSNSYSTCNVIGYAHVGGLVGQHCNGAFTSNSYSIGNVVGAESSAGLVGAYMLDSTVTDSFWDIETSGQVDSDAGTGKITAEMKDVTTFSGAGWNITTVADPGIRNVSYTWNIVDDATYPCLSWQSGVPVYREPDKLALLITSTDGGSGDREKGCTICDCEVTQPGERVFLYDPETVVNLVATPGSGCPFSRWTGDVSNIADINAATTTITMNDNYGICAVFGDPGIRDWYDLDAIRNNEDSTYILMNHLDATTAGYEELASPTANEGQGWDPIGDFGGDFDGQGYEIRDLFINRPLQGGGLFHWTTTEAVIQNVGMVNVDVTGYGEVGGLVGQNQGTVSKSYASGSVTGGESEVGGLVGKNGADEGNAGTINDCYSTCSVTGHGNVGGLVGYNMYAVSSSYSTGNVTGYEGVGGLVGAGYGTVTNSFWDTETSGQSTSAGGTGKTTAEMQDISTFSGATWDIIAVANPGVRNLAYIWNIVDDGTYPFMSWQPVI